MLIDADGLNILAVTPRLFDLLPANTILTPHIGEMARLMSMTTAALGELDRVDVARAQAAEWNCIVLLKGAFTVVARPDGQATIIPFADPVLATAGSGDVLSGVIASLLGQGMEPYEAAIAGAYLHAAAATESGLKSGLLAMEIADAIPEIRAGLTQ